MDISPRSDCDFQLFNSRLSKKYSFLNDEEINNFINNHSWLINESDDSVIDDFVKQHFSSLFERNKAIIEHLQGIKKIPNSEKQDIPNENLIIEEEEEDLFGKCLTQLEILYDDVWIKKSDKFHFSELITFLKIRLKMLVEKPNDEFSRQIQLTSNDKLLHKQMVMLLNSLGFEQINIGQEILLINNKNLNKRFLEDLIDIIDELYLNNPQFIKELNSGLIMNNERMKAQFSAHEQHHVDKSNFLASAHENRLNKNQIIPNAQIGRNFPPSDKPDNNRIDNQVSMRDQINDYREKMKNRQLDQRKFTQTNIITMAEIEKRRIEEEKVAFGNNIKNIFNLNLLGKRALELTNEFRKKNKLPAVQWSQELCDVGLEHSKNMGDGKVPFGHQGFDKRCKSVRFSFKSMAENVALSTGHSDPAKIAVEGWINSPGHRKNLLSASNVCGIAAYRYEF